MSTCKRGGELAAELKPMIAAGDSRETIFQAMVKKHGEGILAAPSQSSWQGKIAPIAPFVVLALGIFPIVYIARTRQRTAKIRGSKQPVGESLEDARLADALKKFDY